jgi:hypothetical protein
MDKESSKVYVFKGPFLNVIYIVIVIKWLPFDIEKKNKIPQQVNLLNSFLKVEITN